MYALYPSDGDRCETKRDPRPQRLKGANQRRNEPTYDDTTRPMRCKADEYRRRQDKLNLKNPSKRKIFAKKSPNVPRQPRI